MLCGFVWQTCSNILLILVILGGKTMRKIIQLEHYQPIAHIFSSFAGEENTVILESSLQNHLGQHSIIARKPYLILEKRNGKFYVNQKEHPEDFSTFLKAYLKDHWEENPTTLPLVHGGIGFFSYDFGKSLHNNFPESIFCFYDELIIEDHAEKTIHLIANGKLESAETALEKLEECINASTDEPMFPQTDAGEVEVEFNFEKEEYKQAVAEMIEHITRGEIHVANMTQRLDIKSRRTPYETYCRLREHNPAPFAAFLHYPDVQVVSASPERFLQMQDGKVTTRPIKGTRKRGETPEEDERLKTELKHSEKDKRELLMIVNLVCDDLNRVCIPDTVAVDELFEIETYATVHHLVASVSGQLASGKTAMDLLDAAFPGGSITGAPKTRAMEVISALERGNRGLYTGAIGYISLNGDCDFNVVIRTAVHQDGVYTLGVGGGITAESDTEFEYEETLQKAKAILAALS